MYKIIRNTIVALGAMFALTACDDYLTLYPEDDMIDDEYWTDASKVESVVAAGYRYMADNNVLRKLLYWGEMRSDNVEYSTGGTEEDNLFNQNLLSSSSLVKWDGFYKVVNICNNVIQKAPAVRDVDVNFTEEKFHNYMAEAYTLRALCYFYLVRAFGDVPYVTEPSDSEQKDYMVKQSAEADVLAAIIADLEQYGIQWAPTDWPTEEYTHGRITLNAVRALLADVYLWRASDATSATQAADYRKVVDYCNAILNDENSTLVFSEYETMYNDVFYQGNATESIFELNFVANGLANSATATLYGNTSKGNTAHFNPTQNLYSKFSDTDARRYQYLQLNYTSAGSEVAVSSYKVFKYEGQRAASGFGMSDYTYRASGSYANWIIYRLADVYLMKAEALAQLAKLDGSEDEAQQAVEACNVIYERANQQVASLEGGSISDAENTVMEERRRELCFEGKRWFDLMRKVRREGSTDGALALIVAARSGDTQLIEARLSSPAAWYLPISKTETNANPNLQQNEYYKLKE